MLALHVRLNRGPEKGWEGLFNISSKMLPLSCAGSIEYALYFSKYFFKT